MTDTFGFLRCQKFKKLSEAGALSPLGHLGLTNGSAMFLHKLTRDKLIEILVLALIVAFLASCSIYVPARAGNRPNLNALETSLQLGKSTRADVVAALGEPIARGMALLPIDPRPNAGSMWSYHYQEILSGNDFYREQNPGQVRGTFLFVFFDGDRYDGYMWYSSLPN